ncbi:MAG TPA: hypothetical protein VGN26_12050 [Armatimonadota bacterium]|jgi:hypothetical protein
MAAGRAVFGMAAPGTKTIRVGRGANDGKSIPVAEAEKRRRTAVVETIKVPRPRK